MSGTDAFNPQILCRQIDAQSGLQSNKSSEEEVEKEKTEPKNHSVWEDKRKVLQSIRFFRRKEIVLLAYSDV